MRKTKIVATVGPSCSTEKDLIALIRSGVDVIRINASHNTPQKLRAWIRTVRRLSRRSGRSVAIVVDLQGPRVRTGPVREGMPIVLRRGERVLIVPGKGIGDQFRITTPHLGFSNMVRVGHSILLDNGYMELRVLRVTKKKIECRIIVGGLLGANKGINLPSAPVSMNSFTLKDRKDLVVAAQEGVDYVALSFVRNAKEVLRIKQWLAAKRKKIAVMAKIEKPEAVRNIKEIIQAADGVMVARGDLGIEMGVEKVPVIQKEIIALANKKGIPVVTATQMLESMIEHPRPTRAEASDIANAVFDGTDAVMLSGETAIGRFPLKAVRVMSNILQEAEGHKARTHVQETSEIKGGRQDPPIYAITHAALHAARDSAARAIIVYTVSGRTAQLISKFRPRARIIALTSSYEVSRRLLLSWGIIPVRVRHGKSTDTMIREGDRAVLKARLLRKGDLVVVLSGKQALPAARYMTKIHYVGDK